MLRLILAVLALTFMAATPARSQSALEWAVSQGDAAQQSHAAPTRRFDRRAARVTVGAPLEIRTSSQLASVALRFKGSRRFTPYARAWCADAMNAWLAMIGRRGTGDGRAISFAHYGRAAGGPRIGAIAVLRHHVGVVIGRTARGVVLISGNHSRRVGIGVYSARRIIAYREPV